MTVGSYAETFIQLHIKQLRRSKEVEACLRKWAAPLWDRPLGAVTRLDVDAWHKAITRPAVGNMALIYLGVMYSYVIRMGLFDGPNPCQGVKKFRTQPRTRFIHPGGEMTRFQQVLATRPLHVRAFFQLIVSTGCRKGEAQACRFEHLDLDTGRWRKPATKTRPHVISIPGPALTLLRALPVQPSGWVFPTQHGNPYSNGQVSWWWESIRAEAGMRDLHLHDLRHTTAIWMRNNGADLLDVQHVLNHKSLRTTQLYLEGCDILDSTRRALERTAERMQGGGRVDTSP